MFWKVLFILLGALCLPWSVAVVWGLFGADYYLQESAFPKDARQPFEAVGVLRRTGKPVVAMLHLSSEQNLNLGYPHATVVKREEVSFNPAEVRKALPSADRDFWGYGGESFVEVRVLDANADGQLDVLFQYDRDTLWEPTRHLAYLYTVRENTPVLLFAARGDISPLEPLRMQDGTYAFVNERTVWQSKAYLWKGGRYQLLGFDTRERRKQMLWRALQRNLPPANWFSLFSLAPAGLLLTTWGRGLQRRLRRGQRVTFWNGYAPLLWLWGAGFATVAWTLIYPRLYHPSFAALLMLLLPLWLASVGAALAQAVIALHRGWSTRR
ncbi:MAG: hypothetical protein RMK92_10385 [Armatimonadota bacterium]|nr:hypothetical protein [Armatimonadota bacterium]